MALLQPPFLTKFDRNSWLKFHRDYAIYVARGGDADFRTLIDPFVLQSLYLTTGCTPDETPDSFKAKVTKKFSASSTQGFYDELKKLKLYKLSQSALVTYTARFQEEVAANEAFGDKQVIADMFI
ncbi:hypothetical protein ADUPG1_011620, partial [Aduncisulcus paluster]